LFCCWTTNRNTGERLEKSTDFFRQLPDKPHIDRFVGIQKLINFPKEACMKFTWFNLMPWPYLPDDFREKYHSVWVDIPNKLYDPQKGHFVYHQYMDQLEYAEQVGFDGIGCNEHHQNGYGLMPSPNIIAAGLSRRTSKAAIAVIGNSLALYNPPIRVAEEFAMLDVMSGGRLLAGFPVGTSMDTNYCYGQIPALTRDKYAEAHELVMRAWAEEEPFAFDGKYNQLRHVNLWPKPIQKPHPPIYIPGGGSIETWDFCLDHDYNYSYLSFTGYLRGKKLLDGYWNQVAKRGKDESPYRGAFAQTICVAETDQEAEKLYAEHVSYFYNRCLHIYGGFADAPGYRTIKTIQADVVNALSEDMQNLFPSLSWKELVDGGYVIAGSPATVRDRLKDLIKGLHVGHIFCLIHVGNMPDWKTRYSTKLFAEKVMPELRNMWPEWKDDNRWWCKPMEERLQPETTIESARQDGRLPL
jgi:alkanesulfonate monooxygenase SsuD/methylene tetrahydromethanopterin reductase-like flavin-dependent oxidoreductase (luciferase family)